MSRLGRRQPFKPLLNRGVPSAGASGSGVANGDGVATSSLVGVSANNQASSGDGVAVSSIVGTSENKQAAAGDGVATSSVVGTSINSQAATGTGVATSSIVGDSAAGGQGVAAGDGVATSSIVGASAFSSSAAGDGVATVSFISDAPTAQQQAGGGHGGKKAKYRTKKQKVWLVEIDDAEYEVDDLEEIQPIVAKKLAKGNRPKVIAKPIVDSPRQVAEIYTQQAWLTQYIPIPAYEKRMNFVDILPYIIAMQEMEEEEEILLLAA